MLSYGEIPQFFFPNGKPLDPSAEVTNKNAIKEVIGTKSEFTKELIKDIVIKILGLPSYFSLLLILRCTNNLKS